MLKSISILLVACLCAEPGIAEPRIGVHTMTTHGEDDLRHLSLSIWYPAQEGRSLEDVGGNAVFVGQPAYRDAAMAPGPYPLVLLSHGGLRSAADSGAWLSGRLAEEGFVVVEVNGPRPESAVDAVDEIWRRPQDVSHVLDRILRDPVWSNAVDHSRIAVAGYALGGTAALALAGGAFDTDVFASSCETNEGGPDCGWYNAHGVSLASVDAGALERTHRDPRIGTAIAIDPEYADVFLAASLRAQEADIRVIWLGAPDRGRFSTAGLPQAVIESAKRYDAFPICTPKGKHVLAEDGGVVSLCDTEPAERARIHDEIADRLGVVRGQ
ncbi:alpha/beta hydrolase family protein [Salipiger mucosus]|uniref:Dienelactone hydrolase n=1 Tax=Salipiger mucosus DSM 16094 TaxID=1123237 RepID=S9QPN7_9RHOB|nr:hypothetical protein [Salipiger mucosus]EPX83411.1 hypothetical protein Salmuc_02019 [Salipiger mucosus DSM 16094]